MSTFLPKPVATSGVELPSEIAALPERLAGTVHDAWAEERKAQGWKHGLRRNDESKEHPGLVPYDELPAAEKLLARKVVDSTLRSVIALGYQIRPSAAIIPRGETPELSAWFQTLDTEGKEARRGGTRGWTFDMDDEPEIRSIPAGSLNVLRPAMEALQSCVYPAWLYEDTNALKKQRRHSQIAACAIWPGVLAVVFAILQLTCHHFSAWRSVAGALMWLELIAVTVALGAVLVGFASNMHHGWLAHRQRAERLRSLKFRALSWPELWCDFGRWKQRLVDEVASHRAINTRAAHRWAREEDAVQPEVLRAPSCVVPEADLKAALLLYRTKRLEFQHHYFQYQAVRAHRSSWIVDTKLGLSLFALSVFVVLVHVIHHRLHPSAADTGLTSFDAVSISIAALLPVLGFGLRAWMAAFEAPRSRNLYRAKASALGEYMKRIHDSPMEVEGTMQHIARVEHFFLSEHREWCRLQMEAEWFV